MKTNIYPDQSLATVAVHQRASALLSASKGFLNVSMG